MINSEALGLILGLVGSGVELAIRTPGVVAAVKAMLAEGAGLGVESYQLPVNEGHLNGP